MTDITKNRSEGAKPASTSRPLLIALLVAGAFFMENLDGTVIATALPQMAVSFGARPVDLNIGMSAYLLTLGVFIPISGWISDRFGARPPSTQPVVGGAVCGADPRPAGPALSVDQLRLQLLGRAQPCRLGRRVETGDHPDQSPPACAAISA